MLSWNSAACQRRVEVAHPLLEQVGLHRRGQRRPHRALVGLERAEERREHLVAIGAHARLPVQRERRRVQAHRLARRQLDGRVGQVGVGEHAVHLAAGPLELARLGGHALLAGAQRVRLAAQRLFQVHAIGRELRLLRRSTCAPWRGPASGSPDAPRSTPPRTPWPAPRPTVSSRAGAPPGRPRRTGAFAYTDEPRQLAIERRTSSAARPAAPWATCRAARGTSPAPAARWPSASLALVHAASDG